MYNHEEQVVPLLPRWAAGLHAGLDFYYGHGLCRNCYSAHNSMPNLSTETHTPHLEINRGWIEGDSYNPRVNWQVIAPYSGGDFMEFVHRRPKSSVIFGCEGNPYIKITSKGSKTVAIGKKGSR